MDTASRATPRALYILRRLRVDLTITGLPTFATKTYKPADHNAVDDEFKRLICHTSQSVCSATNYWVIHGSCK